MRKTEDDWKSQVGEILHDSKELVEYCGMYRVQGSGAKPLFRWKCLRCLKEHGPNQYQDIKRYSQPHCCSKSKNRVRWGYRHISSAYMRSLQGSAQKRNLEFAVTSEDLYKQWEAQEGRCAYTGIPLGELTGKLASIDRIDSLKGYTTDNIQWVLTVVNNMKWTLTHDEFIHICHVIATRNEDQYDGDKEHFYPRRRASSRAPKDR